MTIATLNTTIIKLVVLFMFMSLVVLRLLLLLLDTTANRTITKRLY